MRVLLLGGGGREHALGWKLTQSELLEELVSCPGNPGMTELGPIEPDVDPNDPVAVVRLARKRNIDLVVIGPEAPLAAGVADALRQADIAVFGPSAAGARLEASKTFAKDVMAAAHVPTAPAATFTTADVARKHLEGASAPYVVKADGLAAGKGVLVTDSLDDARQWVDECLDGRFGGEGAAVVIEEFLDGDELSVFFICANGKALPLQPARDYKRLSDGDEGPNTGGMGSYSPVRGLPKGIVEWTRTHVAEPTLVELANRGIDYIGFLYVGLMLTADGPKVVEFNCRLGDPETQVLMPILESDLLPILIDAAMSDLPDIDLYWDTATVVNVVLASPGYPDDPVTGHEIRMTDAVENWGALVFHAGTREEGDTLVTAGGRVLNVVGYGENMIEARMSAYNTVSTIDFTGKQYRKDIGS